MKKYKRVQFLEDSRVVSGVALCDLDSLSLPVCHCINGAVDFASDSVHTLRRGIVCGYTR